jgi:hypothetical protein
MALLKKYGVKLVTYGGQDFNIWVGGEGDTQFSTTDITAAYNEKILWETKNPKGYYRVEEIPEKKE